MNSMTDEQAIEQLRKAVEIVRELRVPWAEVSLVLHHGEIVYIDQQHRYTEAQFNAICGKRAKTKY